VHDLSCKCDASGARVVQPRCTPREHAGEPGELQALSLACELSSNLDALLSGLSGLEQLMLPAMAIDADTACGGLGCLSTLTRLTGTHSEVILAVAGRSQHHMSD